MGVAAAPLPGCHAAPLDSRDQPQGSHPLLDVRGWDRHPGGCGRQEMSAALKNSVGGDRKQKLWANMEMLSELSGNQDQSWRSSHHPVTKLQLSISLLHGGGSSLGKH